MDQGATFEMTGATGLWILISDPGSNPEQIILVRTSSLRRYAHGSIQLDRNDHCELTGPCWLDFGDPLVVSKAGLENLCAQGLLVARKPCDCGLIHRILLAGAGSDVMANKCRESFLFRPK